MSIFKIQTNLVGDFTGKPHLFLNDIEIGMSYNGVSEYQSTDPLDIQDGRLRIYFHGRGIPTAKWTLTIKELQPRQKELYKQAGSIDENGHSVLVDSIAITDAKDSNKIR